MADADGTITRVVNAIAGGSVATDADPHVRHVYEELRRLAHQRLDEERQAPFQTTDLVHEAYVKLFRASAGAWQSRGHFFGSAARAMEQLLIDASRRRRTSAASIGVEGTLGEGVTVDPARLSRALAELAGQDRELAELARLKIFAGVSLPLLAELTSLSERTASRRWAFARTWLYRRLRELESGTAGPTG